MTQLVVADTGATSHILNTKKYLTDTMQISGEITMGTEEKFQCTEKGTYRGIFKNKYGEDLPDVLQKVLYVPMLAEISLSITK
jgi:hypothetical protein